MIAQRSATFRAGAPQAGAIDRAHLARMTFDDRDLQREVLGLFERQSRTLAQRLVVAAVPARALLAHTIKGSARGVGAWRVANAAAEIETACTLGRDAPLAELDEAVAEACATIAELLAER